MRETISAVSNLIRSFVSLAVLGVVSFAGWLGYETFSDLKSKNEVISQLSGEVQAKQKKIDALDLAMRLLKVDHRVAEMTVLDQWDSKQAGRVMTKFQFVE